MLIESAKRGQRSLSEEIEYRLEAALSGEQAFLDNLGGPNTKYILRPLLMFFELLHHREKDWESNEEVAASLGDSIKLIVDMVTSGYSAPKTDLAALREKGGATLEALEILSLFVKGPVVRDHKDQS
jgi:hypothetical protein